MSGMDAETGDWNYWEGVDAQDTAQAERAEAAATMDRHIDGGDGRCVVDGVEWPCGTWISAREAYDEWEFD